MSNWYKFGNRTILFKDDERAYIYNRQNKAFEYADLYCPEDVHLNTRLLMIKYISREMKTKLYEQYPDLRKERS